MKMKKVMAFLLVLTLLVTIPALAANTIRKNITVSSGIQIQLDGKSFTPTNVNGDPVEVFLYQGTTYVPIRAVSQAFGAKIAWDGANSTVIIQQPQAQDMVYITRTGKRYHNEATCNGGTYWPVPLSTATGMGLTPCDKCVNH